LPPQHGPPPTAPDRETHRAVPLAATRSRRTMSGVRGASPAHVAEAVTQDSRCFPGFVQCRGHVGKSLGQARIRRSPDVCHIETRDTPKHRQITATGNPRRRAHGPAGASSWENVVASEQCAGPLEDLDLHRLRGKPLQRARIRQIGCLYLVNAIDDGASSRIVRRAVRRPICFIGVDRLLGWVRVIVWLCLLVQRVL
jgi:hypothetical protein